MQRYQCNLIEIPMEFQRSSIGISIRNFLDDCEGILWFDYY